MSRVPVPPVKRVTVDDLYPIRPPAAPEAEPAPPGRRSAGKTTATYTVWCVGCPKYFEAERNTSRYAAERQWMGWGWCQIEGGWHCPTCSAAYIPIGLREETRP